MKPKLTPEEIARGEFALAKIRALMTSTPKPEVAAMPPKTDLGETDALEYPHDARVRYDSDALGAFFRASAWSDYQIFILAFAITVEHSGPAAVREIQKLSHADAAWARHLATSREPQGGAQ